jgi:hypothetical protein
MNRLVAGLLLGLVAVGCSNGVTWNSPTKKVTKDEMVASSARRGYTEIRREKVIYVVSTPAAVKRVHEGKEPASKVSAIGYGPNGEKVIFEASKDGLEKGLMEEFTRRNLEGAKQS